MEGIESLSHLFVSKTQILLNKIIIFKKCPIILYFYSFKKNVRWKNVQRKPFWEIYNVFLRVRTNAGLYMVWTSLLIKANILTHICGQQTQIIKARSCGP